ncbi:MAG TPA: relaxase/mobilization nuclease domain-containing protein [Puia sp.]|nr:relaxase/mobilization nuclease domain-containing protein [Puia sp.]
MVRQFREVMQTNHNICKPYLHVVLGLPPQDRLTNSQWADVSIECSKALGFEQHQFVAILHRDTAQQHVHLLVNRIGFEGDVVKDRYLLPRISQFCRQTEIDYGLTRMPGPRRYQTEEQRKTPRQDERLHRLELAIGTALKTVCSISAFDEEMRKQGYTVYRNDHGVAFHEERMVIIRGSEAGYPWKRIQQEIAEREKLRQESERQELKQEEELRQTLRHGYRLHH